MPTLLFILAGSAVAALAILGALPHRAADASPRRLADWATAAALVGLASSLAALAFAVRHGAIHTGTLGVAGVGASLYLDVLSTVMAALVCLVGAVVLRYSRSYLDGDPRQGAFLQMLALALAAVLATVLSGNLVLTGLAWFGTGVALRRLLVFFPGRPAAILAARKNLLFSRLADLCLIVAAVLLHHAAGSLDFAALFARAAEWRVAGLPAPVGTACALIAVAALLKSAQFPVHGWLLEVMETPTPVSALLHAGIINGGGFLVLRVSPLIDQAPGALALLAAVGAVTAVFGSLVMLTQTSVKVGLAFSTVAQMGFMMLECGLGAYPAALLHIVAHSFYKAHAFLSSGSVVELHRAAWVPRPGDRAHPARLAFALVAALGVVAAAGWAFGAGLAEQPGAFVLGTVLVLGLTQLLANGMDARMSRFVVGRVLGLAALLAAAYFALHAGTERLWAAALPLHVGPASASQVALAAAVVLAFAGLTVFQVVAVGHVDGPRWRALHAHVANGFYLNTLVNRWLLRLWPPGPAATRTPSLGADA